MVQKIDEGKLLFEFPKHNKHMNGSFETYCLRIKCFSWGTFDFVELKAFSSYVHQYNKQHKIIFIFWKIIDSILYFHVSFTFLVLLFWTFLVRFSGPPTPSCQKE